MEDDDSPFSAVVMRKNTPRARVFRIGIVLLLIGVICRFVSNLMSVFNPLGENSALLGAISVTSMIGFLATMASLAFCKPEKR